MNEHQVKSLDMDKASQDCVVFMTAYNINHRRLFPRLSFRKKEKLSEILSKFRISLFASGDSVITKKGRLKYTTQFDPSNPSKQVTKFRYEASAKDETTENYQDEIRHMSWVGQIKHSMDILLDRMYFSASVFINMEQFLVLVNSRLLQVDSFAFFLKGVIYVYYELINYKNGVPLNKDDIYGIKNNYNIIPVEGVQYFGEKMEDESRSIPHIIFENIVGFLDRINHNELKVESCSYVHNILVRTNKSIDLQEYLTAVTQADGMEFNVKNINTNDAYEFYSVDAMGVVVAKSDECRGEALFAGLVLEALKMYVYVNQIVAYDIISKLNNTLDKCGLIDGVLFARNTPIVTYNTINNIKNTFTYKNHKDAIDFKISYLGMLQERKRNGNALLLNVLLYILSFIGGISTLQVLQDEFGWSFKCGVIILTAVFVSLGILWGWKERKNR